MGIILDYLDEKEECLERMKSGEKGYVEMCSSLEGNCPGAKDKYLFEHYCINGNSEGCKQEIIKFFKNVLSN